MPSLKAIIKELKVKNYGYNDVKEILESITHVDTAKNRPQQLKKGDVYRVWTGKKNRPVVVIKVTESMVIGLPLSSTKNALNLHNFKSRFFGEGYFSKAVVTTFKNEAMEDFVGVMEDRINVNIAIKKLKTFISETL